MGLAERFSSENKQVFITNADIKSITAPADLYKKFEDLETDTIAKIRKTPHWKEYSAKTQEKMISKYFDSKIKNGYKNIKFSQEEKNGFIDNILTLANNR